MSEKRQQQIAKILLTYNTTSTMVLSNLNNRKELEKLNPLFKTLFEYLDTHNMAELPLGRYDILGDTLFINNACPKVGTIDEMPLEAHRKYIDVQVILEG